MSILGFFRQRGVVGIDLGSYAIKVVEIVQGKTGPMVRSFGQIRLPTGCILGGVLKEPEIVAEKLEKLIKNLKIKSKKAVISLSSYAAIIKRIKLDIPEDKDLDTSIYEEAEAQIPFNLEDVYIDYQILSEDNNTYDILLVAARREVVDEINNLVQKTGLTTAIIDIDLLAVGNLTEFIYEPQNPVIIIDIGATKASVILWQNGGPIISRDITFGAHEINEELQNELKITVDEAEKLKLGGPKTEDQKEIIKNCFLEFYKKFSKDLENTLEYFESITGYSELNYEKIYLCGGGSHLPNLPDFLARKLGKKIEIISPFLKLDKDKNFDENYLEIIGIEGAASLGLGIRELVYD